MMNGKNHGIKKMKVTIKNKSMTWKKLEKM